LGFKSFKTLLYLGQQRKCKKQKNAFVEAQRRLKNGVSICIFPEGGVPNDITKILDDFKDGAFRLSIEHQIPIVPISFPDVKKDFAMASPLEAQEF